MNDMERALAQIRSGKIEEGLAALDRLVEDPERRDEAMGHRAWVKRTQGRYEEAIADLETLRGWRPGDDYVAVLLAEARLLAGYGARAAAEAAGLLQRDPANARAAGVIVRYQASLGLPAAPPAPDPAGRPFLPMNETALRLESDPAQTEAAVSPEIGRLLYLLTRMLRPCLALEVGCFAGYSTLCIAQAIRENGEGHLHSFDLFSAWPGYVSPVLGAQPDMLHVVRGHLERADLAECVTLHKGDSSQQIRETLAPGATPRFGLAFIDGDHRIRGCLKDWNAIHPLIAEGGFVLLHDTQPQTARWLGPRTLLERLGAQAADYAWVNLPTHDGAGLGLIQKRSSRVTEDIRPSIPDLLADVLFNRAMGWHKKPKPE